MMTLSNGNVSALLALCEGNSPVTEEFPSHRPVARNFDVLFDLRLNKRLSKQWWGWWFETPLRPLGRHCNLCTRVCFVFFCINMCWLATTTTKTHKHRTNIWIVGHATLEANDTLRPIFSKSFSWTKSFIFWIKFHWRLFLKAKLTKKSLV